MEYGNKSDVNQKKTVSRMEELYERWRELLYRIFPGMTVKERFIFAVSLVFTALTAFFAAEKSLPFLPVGAENALIRPLGDGILCAVGGAAPAVFLALVFSAYASGKAVVHRIALLSVVFIIRTLIGLRGRDCGKYGIYREGTLVKVTVAAGFSLLCTAARLLFATVSGVSASELLVSLLLTPAVTAALCGALGSDGAFDTVNRRGLSFFYSEISRYLFLMLVVYALGGQSFMGSDVSVIAAIFLTVTAAFKGGVFRGGILGIMLGFTVSVRYAPVTAVVGIFAGVLSGLGISSFVWLSCLAGCLLAAYAYGYRALIGFIPDSIIATAVTAPVIKYGFLPDGFPFPHKRLMGGATSDGGGDNKDGVGANPKDLPHESGIGECGAIAEVSCAAMLGMTSDALGAVSEIWRELSEKNGKARECTADVADVGESIRNDLCGSLANGVGFLFNTAYASEILRDTAETVADSVTFDPELTERAKKAVSSLGIEADGAVAYGGRIKRVAVDIGGFDGTVGDGGIEAELASRLSAECGLAFSPVIDSREKAYSRSGCGKTLVFISEPQFSASFYCARRRATGEERNGDSAIGFVTEDSFFNFVLCDGMGSGEEAANCSENAVNSLKKLLESRVSPRLSAKLTGNFVKDGYEECFTTLDLLRVDLVSGRGEILKSGAACSYLLRNKSVRRLSFPSLPLGLSYDTVPDGEEIWLKDGDVLVAVSDGMADDEEEECALAEAISHVGGFTPEVMAERLISERMRKTEGNKRRDDMTVAVVKIKKR